MIITFFAPGDPKGQPRPRAFSIGGSARVYDPGTAEGWKSSIAVALNLNYIDKLVLTGPLQVELLFWFRRPKSHYTSKGELRTASSVYHTQKPDADNLAKAVLDALTTLQVWTDDAQIVCLHVEKRWALKDPGCRIKVETIQ